MVPHRRRHVDIRIRVVQRVKPPEKRHGVLASVERVAQKIEHQEADYEAHRYIGDRPVWQPEMDRTGLRKQKAGKKQVQDPKADIAETAPQRGKFAPPPRQAEFP
jgi:hypothetical protein